MSGVVERLEQGADDAGREAARLRELVERGRELGGDALAELGALLGSETTSNGHTSGRPAHVPRGREAVRRIVRDRPGIWTLSELREEMRTRGWFTSSKGLEVAVVRLCEAGECRRVSKGRYEFPPERGEGAIESDASGAAMIASP